MALGYTFAHAGNAASVSTGQFEILYDELQYISVHDLQNCVLEYHWIVLFVVDVSGSYVNSTA